MRIRSTGLGLFAGLSILVAACSSGASTAPSTAATTAPTTAPAMSEAPSASASAAPSASVAHSDLKIGVVTDIGTLDDKNYNEYTFKGVSAAAAAIGADAPPAVVPKDQTQYAPLIQAFIDQKFNMIVTVGFNNAGATGVAAVKNPTVQFIGVDQGPICLKADGTADFTLPCPTDPKVVAPNYISIDFQEDQAGYLAGIVAASVSKSGTIGAIGGTTLCAPCVRYIQGYALGAQSVNPNVVVKTAYVTNDFSDKAFNDPVGGKKFAQSFITTNKVDVLFQVAGKTGNGVLDAACDANIYGVGVDVDQALSYPNAAKCIVTSAEKHLQLATGTVIQELAAGQKLAGDVLFDAKTQGIGNSPGHDLAALITPDIQTKLDTALAAMVAGTLQTCPTTGCGVYSK